MPSITCARDPQGAEIYRSIVEEIRAKRLRPGTRLLPARELQRQFGLSYSAVLAGLRRLQRDGFVVCRPGSGTYVSEAVAGVVGRAAVKRVGIVNALLPEDERFVRPMLEALEAQLSALDCDYSIESVPGTVASAEVVEHCKADVYIWVRPTIDPLVAPDLKVPSVFLDHAQEIMWGVQDGCDIVTADALQGGVLAGRHLREIGCRRVAVVAPRRFTYHRLLSARRIMGFEAGWGEPVNEFVRFSDESGAHAGARMVDEILSLRPVPDGVFVTADSMAFGFCHGLIAHGIQPGKDIKVIGFDGQPPLFEGDPALTSVRVPLEALGRMAARLALERAEDPRKPAQKVYLACTLKKGDSA